MSLLNVAQAKRRIIAAPKNPLDKSTVVSIYPKRFEEIKHTIQPGRFIVEAGSMENPSILVVGSSSWWREIDEEQPLLEIPTSSVIVADSIVKDFCSGLLGYSAELAMPGIFWVPGAFTVEQIKQDYSHLLLKAEAQQKAWYLVLVRLTDGLWARTNGNPLVISDDARMAAKELGLTDKDWMKDFTQSMADKCPACGSIVNLKYPVCSNCKTVINEEKYNALNLKTGELPKTVSPFPSPTSTTGTVS